MPLRPGEVNDEEEEEVEVRLKQGDNRQRSILVSSIGQGTGGGAWWLGLNHVTRLDDYIMDPRSNHVVRSDKFICRL